MTDFSVARRMSLGAFFIYFLKFFRLVFNASLIFMVYQIFSADNSFAGILLKIAGLVGCVFVLALIIASLNFFQVKFQVIDGNLVYRRHFITSTTTTIPLNRIHTLRTRQGLLYRILNLRGVLFDTLASQGEEIELILSESDWQSLLARIESEEHSHPSGADISPITVPVSRIKFSNRDLVLDALCQNHLKGMVILGGFVTAILNWLSDLSENVTDQLFDYLESNFDRFALSLAGIAVIMACTYVLSLALWLGKVFLRYYDLTLTYDSNMLTFSHGLFSRMSSRFARDKICSLCIKRNYFEERLGLCTLSMKQALNSSARKEEDNLKIYSKDNSGFFLSWWLGQEYGTEVDIASANSGNGVVIHTLLPDLFLSLGAAGALWYFGFYGWIILPALYLAAGIPKSILTMRRSYIILKDSYLIISKGRFAGMKSYLKYSNVEVVRVTRTPLSRFTGRGSLTVSTAGSCFKIRSLKYDQAKNIREIILSKTIVLPGQ